MINVGPNFGKGPSEGFFKNERGDQGLRNVRRPLIRWEGDEGDPARGRKKKNDLILFKNP
jgi:hypothetical protein